MCSLTNYDLLDMADQAMYYRNPHNHCNQPRVLCNLYNAYSVEEHNLGACLHYLIWYLDTQQPYVSV